MTRRNGMSLVEVLLAVLFLSTVMVASLSAISTTLVQSNVQSVDEMAAMLAHGEIERWRGTRFSEIRKDPTINGNGANVCTGNANDPYRRIPMEDSANPDNPVNFPGFRTNAQCDGPTPDCLANTTGGTNFKIMTVTIFYNPGNGRTFSCTETIKSVSLTTIISR